MGSDDRLSTRDIASPSGGETDEEPQRFERTDRDSGKGAVAADRAEPVGDGDVVTEEPAGGRAESRESIADRDAGRDTAADRPAADAAAPAPADRTADTTTARADTGAAPDTGAANTGDAAPLLSDADSFQARWEEVQVRFVDEPRGAVEDA